ncbi:MAG: PPOX class F420-dependent oxidoreductase [Candidatus Hodarchaeales archaeon]|jgi:PPOX class probable F420-dependent enzyme
MNKEIPESHLDLVKNPYHGVLTTIMPDGQPQSSIVWCDYDGKNILINTTKERQKGKNMILNPKASIIIIDPSDVGRFISIRGNVEIIEENASTHLDEITRKFTKYQHYYGNIYPLEQKEKETRIICKIKPIKIILDAIHN